jgi:superkiller protein 3
MFRRLTWIVVYTVLTGALFCPAGAQMKVNNPRVAKSSARNYIKQRVPDKAFEMCQLAVELDPNDPEARFMLGTFYADKEMIDEMNDQFNACLSHKEGQEFLKKGMRLVGANDFLLGGIWYTRETLWTRYYNIGVRALNSGDTKGALDEFHRAARVLPERADTYKGLGKVYLALDSLDVAIDQYKKALDIDSTLVEAWADIGVGLLQSNKTQDAIPYLRKAHELKPENLSICRVLAQALWVSGEKDGAVAVAEQALTINPDDPGALSLAGSIYTDAKNYEKAVAHLEKAVEKQPDSPDIVFNLANAYLGQGNLDKAAGLFHKSIEVDPNDFQAHYQLGSIYDKGKEYDKAIGSFEKVTELKPQWSQGWGALYKAYAHKSAVSEGEAAQAAAKKAEEAMMMEQTLKSQGK